MMAPTKLAALFLALTTLGFHDISLAQESTQEPIYLPEPDKEPPPTIVRQNTTEEKYDDQTPHIIRGLAYLSDDQVVNHGKYVEFYPDGQQFAEGSFELGLYSGQWKFWHPNGQLCKTVTFNSGRPDGSWDIFRPDGTREATKGYQDGLRHGPWTIYFDDGENPKIQLTYDKGRLVGERLVYHPNGQIRQKLPFKNGVVEGIVESWDENGKKISEVEFKQGKPVSKMKRF